MKVEMVKEEIEYQNPFEFYCRKSSNGENISLLMESRSINLKYGRKSIIIPNPAVKIIGQSGKFEIIALTKTGKKIIAMINDKDLIFARETEFNEKLISGIVDCEKDINLNEKERSRQKNISYLLRMLINKFDSESQFSGMYGAIGYDFAKNFYNGNPGKEFVLFIPTIVYVFDDIKERAEKLTFKFDGNYDSESESIKGFDFEKKEEKTETDLTEKEYLEKAEKIIKQIRAGRAMQCVFSRRIKKTLQRHPIESYKQLRDINPSPYSFYFNFGDNEILYGASPEMHISIQTKNIEIRPIAGTIKRSKNPVEDANARISLLTDEKEIREHTMLVDLARHEMHGLAEKIVVTDLFTLEVYPNLYHLVSGVKGNLSNETDAVDALLVTMPAGTLSGAPKKEAMKMIDENENSSREFYGGVVGYLSFNGDCNTGITIRSVHVKDGFSNVRAGGGIVALSTPENELKEIKLKMENSLKILGDEE